MNCNQERLVTCACCWNLRWLWQVKGYSNGKRTIWICDQCYDVLETGELPENIKSNDKMGGYDDDDIPF